MAEPQIWFLDFWICRYILRFSALDSFGSLMSKHCWIAASAFVPDGAKAPWNVWSIAAVQRRYLNTLSADGYFLLSIFEGGILYFVWVQWNWEVCWTSITQACVFSLAQCCVRLFVGWHLSVTWAETDLPKRHTAHFIPDDPTVAPQLELRWASALLLFLLIYLVYLGVQFKSSE